jgi:hypothetical protein
MTIEEEMGRKKLTELGFDVGEFSFEFVEVNDFVQSEYYLDRKVLRVIRKSNGKSQDYLTGHGVRFPDDFGDELKTGEFE